MSRITGCGDGSNWECMGKIWTKFWKAKVPEGVKLLSWRIYYNAIPVMRNLFRRGVVQNGNCCVCGFGDESVEHVVLECWWAKSLWLNINNTSDMARGEGIRNIKDWLWSVLSEDNSEVTRKVLFGLKLIWDNRNAIMHGKQGWSPSLSEFKIKSTMAQIDQRKLLGFTDPGIGERIANIGWEVFCDGSWSGTERSGGWAAILRRNNVIMECRTGYASGEVSGLQTEINALVLGFQLAVKHGAASATFYSDCAGAVWTIQKGKRANALRPEILSTSSSLLIDNPGWEIRHIFREENCAADFLARKARADRWMWERDDAIPLGSGGW